MLFYVKYYMKEKLLLAAIVLLSTFTVLAELNGDGYYRVQNALTKRYVYLMDNKGHIDIATTSADVHALHLYSGFLRASSDPATIFYVENNSGSYYDIKAQGTGLYEFLSHYLKIIKGKEVDGKQAYYAYASSNGMTKYLGDIRSDESSERGNPSVDAKGDCRLWYIDEVKYDEENYFGIAPTLTSEGKYYYPLYAGFPYSSVSDDVKFYVISIVDSQYEVVVLSELSGYVPEGTPVIVECANPLASDNRVNVGINGEKANVGVNYLKGVYFDNDMTTHYNRTPYQKTYMRSLDVVDGKLTFVKGDYEFVPRNQAYLNLPNGTQQAVENYRVVSESEYNELISAVSTISQDVFVDVYNIEGNLVKTSILKKEVHSLPSGLYILKSGDSTEKVLVN